MLRSVSIRRTSTISIKLRVTCPFIPQFQGNVKCKCKCRCKKVDEITITAVITPCSLVMWAPLMAAGAGPGVTACNISSTSNLELQISGYHQASLWCWQQCETRQRQGMEWHIHSLVNTMQNIHTDIIVLIIIIIVTLSLFSSYFHFYFTLTTRR